MSRTPLREIAHARSGDKGAGANVGVIAYTPTGFDLLRRVLTAAVVEDYFKPMGVGTVRRYEMPNIGALNFVLPDILRPGSLRTDAQGKALGQLLLELELDVPDDLRSQCRRVKPTDSNPWASGQGGSHG